MTKPVVWWHETRGRLKAGTATSIILGIGNRMGPDGTGFVSNATLAADLMVSVKTIERYMPAVKASGWVRAVRRGQRGRATEWELVIPAVNTPQTLGFEDDQIPLSSEGESGGIPLSSVQIPLRSGGTRGPIQEASAKTERETKEATEPPGRPAAIDEARSHLRP